MSQGSYQAELEATLWPSMELLLLRQSVHEYSSEQLPWRNAKPFVADVIWGKTMQECNVRELSTSHAGPLFHCIFESGLNIWNFWF